MISRRRVSASARVRCSWSEPCSAAGRAAAARRTPRQPPPAPPQPAAPAAGAVRRRPERTIRSIAVRGNQRLEPETVRAYANLSPGQTYTASTLDQALKDLYATELFADVVITGADTGNLVITVRENPVINRIVLEGNKRLKDDKILPEIKLAPRQIFTRSEGPRRRRPDHRALSPPGPLRRPRRAARSSSSTRTASTSCSRSTRATSRQGPRDQHHRQRRSSATAACARRCSPRQAGGLLGFFKSNDTYDPDRLAADQQKLRAFYLTQGYADFRVVSALAELTPTAATSSSPMWSRKARATSSARSRPKARSATCNAEMVKQLVKMQAGRLVQRQAGRGHGHRPQRGGRQPRLCLRRRQPGLQPRSPKSS